MKIDKIKLVCVIIAIILLILVTVIIVAGLLRTDEVITDQNVQITELVNVYTYHDGPDPIGVQLNLINDETFTFVFSIFSSHFCFGDYDLTEDTLTLRCDSESSHIWVFDVAEDGFIFDASRSSAMPLFKYSADSEPQAGVVDGAHFVSGGIEKYSPYSHIDPTSSK